ncbi:MAG TPA: elongation factor P [Patescibacteria group bacterium]|nr:elongation factor P [Patescibacteria group bacterium]
MIGVTELKAGTTFKEDGNLYVVISYEHIKMGRGSANIKVKVKNLNNGATVDKSYINGAKVNDVMVIKRELQFLYKDEDSAYFMNPQTYEQIAVPLKRIDGAEYLKEGETFTVSFLDEEALSVALPPKLVFKVVDTAPGVKGNSATNVFKDAELENGITTKVPLFIQIGDTIRVDTRTGAYTEKA